MCGIAGIVGHLNSPDVSGNEVSRMCAAIIHRGPDDQGSIVLDRAAMGMRRLSIIDVARGHQPIHNEDKSIWIVFNGEIYTFQTLRSELLSAGHHFYTGTDTEVILHAYEQWGENCVRKLRGMFAFAIYDRRDDSLLLVRDRLGKKPLHYAEHEGRLLFASEIKSLLAINPGLADIDSDALLQYFYFGYIPDPATAFKSIKKLPPGHLLRYRNGTVQVRQYWDVPSADRPATAVGEEEYIAELERRLAEAVKIRLISEVPLGALLSGGVDSSLVVGLMARASSRPVKTFSAAFSNEQFDESKYAQLVAKAFGTDHHELVVEPNLWDTTTKLSAHVEEPFADSSLLPTYYISMLARQHVTVALSGDGGDEVFAGYDRYQEHQQRAQRFPFLAGPLGRLYRTHIFPKLPSGTYGRNLIYNYSLPEYERYLDSVTFLPVVERERPLFSCNYLNWAETRPEALDIFRAHLKRSPYPDKLRTLQYLDMKTYLPGDILAKVDRMSMAASLEMRSPLLDHEIVEWAGILPNDLKICNGQTKYILKKVAERIGVPRDVLYRPKQGFSLPLPQWMRSELKNDIVQILTEAKTIQRGYFNPRTLSVVIDEHVSGRRNHSGMLWQLLMLELWFRNFVEARYDSCACLQAGNESGKTRTAIS